MSSFPLDYTQALLATLCIGKFFGKIQLNFHAGKIVSIKKEENLEYPKS